MDLGSGVPSRAPGPSRGQEGQGCDSLSRPCRKVYEFLGLFLTTGMRFVLNQQVRPCPALLLHRPPGQASGASSACAVLVPFPSMGLQPAPDSALGG